MRTYLNCIPCFFKQAIEACKMIGLSDATTKTILDKVALQIPGINMTSTPPEMGMIIHRIIREHTGDADPYKKLKQRSNELALEFYPGLKQIVEDSEDKLLKAVEIAIAGNIIDYGAIFDLDIEKEISSILNSEKQKIKRESSRFFSYSDFLESLKNTNTLLYLHDNAGEIVFDRILLEEITTSYPHIKIFSAVRGNPVINDCTLEDAFLAKIDDMATVISNGMDAPGTILNLCSKEFLEIWNQSDLIISKGQGNFESLSDSPGNIFFLFIAKCQVLVKDMGCRLRDAILYRNNPVNK